MITLSQMNVTQGRPDLNLKKLLSDIKIAQEQGSDLHIAPEMALPGYLLGDTWERDRFIDECQEANLRIIQATHGSVMSVIWGNVLCDRNMVNEDGRMRKYNAAFVARDGAMLGSVIKTLMPNYREFDDKRHFTSLKERAFEENVGLSEIHHYYSTFEIIVDGVKRQVGITICEDLWDDDYSVKPVNILKEKGADLIVNISASPFGIGKQQKRDRLLRRQSQGIDVIYLNHVGAQNNSKNIYPFDGASVAYKNGEKRVQLPNFQEGVFQLREQDVLQEDTPLKILERALVSAIQEYMKNSGGTKLVIGLSGGVDSALVAMLAVRALGSENILAVNMPSIYNSHTTKELAYDLAKELQIPYYVVPIQESVDYTKDQIEKILGIHVTDLMQENIQARDRGSRVLMAIAGQKGHRLSNNGNKLEIATGYATIAGDLNGSVAIVGDLYKTQIFQLARSMSVEYDIPTLEKICSLPPSAELSLDHSVDEGKGDPFFFEYHDRLMYQFLEMRKDPIDLLLAYKEGNLEELLNSWSYDVGNEHGLKKPIVGENGYFTNPISWITDIERIWILFCGSSTIKGKYIPTIVSVSRRALGYDLRRSEMGTYFSEAYEQVKADIISQKK